MQKAGHYTTNLTWYDQLVAGWLLVNLMNS